MGSFLNLKKKYKVNKVINKSDKKTEKNEFISIDLSNSESYTGNNIKILNKFSKVIDLVIEETMPKIYKKNIEQAYKESKKQIDFIMRHLIN